MDRLTQNSFLTLHTLLNRINWKINKLKIWLIQIYISTVFSIDSHTTSTTPMTTNSNSYKWLLFMIFATTQRRMQVILFGGRGGLTSRKINMSRVFSIITGINHFKTKAHHLGGTFLNCIALNVFKPSVDSQTTITVHRCKERHTVQEAYTSGVYLVSEQFSKRLGCWYLVQNFETV